MPKKQRSGNYPNYTKVFSNLASLYKDVDFIKDDWDPFEELNSMKAGSTSWHILIDFEFGLHDIKSTKYEMK